MMHNYKSTVRTGMNKPSLSEMSDQVWNPKMWTFILTIFLGIALSMAAKAQEIDADWPLFLKNGQTPGTTTQAFNTSEIRAIAVDEANNKMYVGGNFNMVGYPRNSAAIFDNDGNLLADKFELENTQTQMPIITKIINDGDGGFFIAGTFRKIQGENRMSIARINANLEVMPIDFNLPLGYGVNDMLIHDEVLYVSGFFISAMGQARTGIFAYDLNSDELIDWNPNLNGAGGPVNVTKLTVAGNRLVAIGNLGSHGVSPNLTTLYRIAAYKIDEGLAFDDTFIPEIVRDGDLAITLYDIAAYEERLFVVGLFDEVDGVERKDIVEFYFDEEEEEGAYFVSSWNPNFTISSGSTNLSSLTIHNQKLYVLGTFEGVWAHSTNKIAAFDLNDFNNVITEFQTPDLNVYGAFTHITSFEGEIMVSIFSASGHETIDEEIRFGSAFFDAETGALRPAFFNTSNGVRSAYQIGTNKRLAVGTFVAADMMLSKNLAEIDLTNRSYTDWNFNVFHITEGVSTGIYELLVDSDKLYVGGSFDRVEGNIVRSFAAYDVTTRDLEFTTSVFPSTSSQLNAMFKYGDKLYVGGLLGEGTGQKALLRLNLTDYSIDTEFDFDLKNEESMGNISAMQPYGDLLYIGGRFTETNPDDTGYTGMAAFDLVEEEFIDFKPEIGYSSSDLNSGIRSFYVSGDKMYVAGYIEEIASVQHRRLAEFDLSTQTFNADKKINFEAGNGYGFFDVFAQGKYVYAGGMFTSLGGGTSMHIARFFKDDFSLDTDWNPNLVGSNAFPVHHLQKYDEELLVSGSFSFAGSPAQYRPTLVGLSIIDPPLELVSITPESGNTEVEINQTFEFTFNRPVVKGTNPAARLQLINKTEDTGLSNYLVDEENISGWGTTTISVVFPSVLLAYETEYLIYTYNEFFKDDEDNEWDLALDNYSFTVRSRPEIAGIITAISPESGSVNLPSLFELTIEFDRDIEMGSGHLQLFEGENPIQSISAEDPDISVAGNVFTLYKEFQHYNRTLSVIIDDGFIKDVAGNDYLGIDDNTYWTFSIGEQLSLIESNPNVAGGYYLDFEDETVFSFTYSRDLTNSGEGEISLIRTTDDVLLETWSHDSEQIQINGSELTITFAGELEAGESYQIKFDDELIVAADNGQRLPSRTINILSVIKEGEPVFEIDNVWPWDVYGPWDYENDFLSGVFDRLVAVGSGHIYLRDYYSGEIVKSIDVEVDDHLFAIPLSFPGKSNLYLYLEEYFQHGYRYYIEIEEGAFTDTSPNKVPFSGFSDKDYWSFTIIASDAPVIESFQPMADASNVATSNPVFTLTFNRPVVVDPAVSITLRADADDQLIHTFTASERALQNGRTLVLTPGNLQLDHSTEYYLEISGADIKDLAENAFEGLAKGDYQFTTATPLPVALSATYPANEAVNVFWNNDIELEFNQPMSYTGGNGKVRLKNHATDATVISFQASQISAFDNFVELSTGDNFVFANGTKYYLEVDADAFKSDTDEFFEGFTNKDDYSFTAGWDMPEVSNRNPAHNAVDVSRSQAISITFDRPITLQTEVGVSNDALFHVRIRQTPIGGGSFVDTDYLISNGAITFTGNTLTITPNEELDYASEVNVLILNNVVMGLIEDNGEFDHTGPLQGANSTSFYRFYTEKESQTIDFAELQNVNLNELEGTVLLSATASSGLDVSFEVVSGPATLVNGNELEIIGTGSVTVKATQEGNDQFAAATAVERSFNVFDTSKEDQTITFDEIANKTYGDATFSLSATATSGLGVSYEVVSGAVSLAGNEVSINGTGSVTIRATQSGNEEFNPAQSVERSFQIAKAAMSITAENQIITYGDALPNLTYTLSGLVYDEDESVLSTAVEISTTADEHSDAGEYAINVNAATADNYEISFTNAALLINKASQVITFDALQDVDINQTGAIDLSASSSAGLIVSFELISGLAELTGSSLTLNGTGTVVVRANQSGNQNYLPAAVERSFNVFDTSKEDQTITFEEIANKIYGDATFSLSATASSSLDVSYEVVSGAVSLAGNVLSITGTGSVTIRATQSGNEEFNPASSVERSFEIAKAVMSITAENQTISYGDALPNLTYTLSGLVYDEDESVLSTTVVISTSADENSDAGEYAISVSAATADNYEISFVAGVLSINQALQTISIEPISTKFVDDEDFEVTASTTSGLALVYEIISGPATISGNTISLTGAEGTVEVKVSQAGNQNYEAAEASIQFAVVDETTVCDNFEVGITTKFDVSCHGSADGSINLSVTGGVQPYIYIWSHGADTKQVENLTAGTYSVTVRDQAGCEQVLEVIIEQPTAISITADIRGSNNSLGNGYVHLTVSGGASPYQYAWSNGANTANINNLLGGSYTVSITDANDCTLEESFEVPVISATETAAELSMKLWPNPVVDAFSLEVPARLLGKRAQVLNMAGQVVDSFVIEAEQVQQPVGQLRSGMYLIRLEGEEQMLKFVKK